MTDFVVSLLIAFTAYTTHHDMNKPVRYMDSVSLSENAFLCYALLCFALHNLYDNRASDIQYV